MFPKTTLKKKLGYAYTSGKIQATYLHRTQETAYDSLNLREWVAKDYTISS